MSATTLQLLPLVGLYDLTDQQLTQSLQSIVSSAHLYTVDNIQHVERQVLLIHRELHERSLYAQQLQQQQQLGEQYAQAVSEVQEHAKPRPASDSKREATGRISPHVSEQENEIHFYDNEVQRYDVPVADSGHKLHQSASQASIRSKTLRARQLAQKKSLIPQHLLDQRLAFTISASTLSEAESVRKSKVTVVLKAKKTVLPPPEPRVLPRKPRPPPARQRPASTKGSRPQSTAADAELVTETSSGLATMNEQREDVTESVADTQKQSRRLSPTVHECQQLPAHHAEVAEADQQLAHSVAIDRTEQSDDSRDESSVEAMAVDDSIVESNYSQIVVSTIVDEQQADRDRNVGANSQDEHHAEQQQLQTPTANDSEDTDAPAIEEVAAPSLTALQMLSLADATAQDSYYDNLPRVASAQHQALVYHAVASNEQTKDVRQRLQSAFSTLDQSMLDCQRRQQYVEEAPVDQSYVRSAVTEPSCTQYRSTLTSINHMFACVWDIPNAVTLSALATQVQQLSKYIYLRGSHLHLPATTGATNFMLQVKHRKLQHLSDTDVQLLNQAVLLRNLQQVMRTQQPATTRSNHDKIVSASSELLYLVTLEKDEVVSCMRMAIDVLNQRHTQRCKSNRAARYKRQLNSNTYARSQYQADAEAIEDELQALQWSACPIQDQAINADGSVAPITVLKRSAQAATNDKLAIVDLQSPTLDPTDSSALSAEAGYQFGQPHARPPLYFNLLWTWRPPRIQYDRLLCWQRINHFSDSKMLTRKDLLKKCLDRYTQYAGFKHAHEFAIMPQTYVLPQEAAQLLTAFTAAAETQDNYWISKPVNLSRGRGISITTKLDEVSLSDASVVQRYIARPLLLHGYKFDLRLYVLVTSYAPLECFIYEQGFARFTTVPYTADVEQLGNRFVHLTNSSVQKENLVGGDVLLPAELQENDGVDSGNKLSLATLNQRLQAVGVDTAAVWQSIDACIVKALVCAEDHITDQVGCFEVYGFDIMLDEQLKPWLLEVNASPSMGLDTTLDRQVKPQMMADTIDLVQPLAYDRQQLSDLLIHRLQTDSWDISDVPAKSREQKEARIDAQLHRLLHGQKPRLYGELPAHMGQYRRLAPSLLFDRVMRMKRAAFAQRTSALAKHKQSLPIIV